MALQERTYRSQSCHAVAVARSVCEGFVLSPDDHPEHCVYVSGDTVWYEGEAARAFAEAIIVPLHCEGWAHFSEGPGDVDAAFAEANLQHRLRLLRPGGIAEFPG